MSENIDCNLSLGVTDAGTIGNDITVGILSVEKDNEIMLLINNLLHSDHLVNLVGMPNKKKPLGTSINSETTKRYIAKMIRNNSLKMTFFRLEPKEQFKLLHEISILEGKKLYEIGKTLDSSNYQYIGKALQLRYQYPKLFVDTLVKSTLEYLALNWIIKNNECGYAELFKQNILTEKRMAMHVIVDGGPQFSSYQDLLNDSLKTFWSNLKTAEASTFYWNLMIATHGIANAKYFYPIVSSINLLTSEFNNNSDSFLYSNNNILHDVTANEILLQKDFIGKSLLEELHGSYLERTGSTFRPPKLWRIGNFSNLGEYELTLPYLMLQKSIREKRITAREVDDDVSHIERFYQYNNPLERDAFIIGEITEKDYSVIDKLKELEIEGTTIQEEILLEEYQKVLNEIANYVQSDNCIISATDQKGILEKITAIEKNDFKKIKQVKIPTNLIE